MVVLLVGKVWLVECNGGKTLFVWALRRRISLHPSCTPIHCCTGIHVIAWKQVKSAGTTVKDKLETASLEAGLPKPGKAAPCRWVKDPCTCATRTFVPIWLCATVWRRLFSVICRPDGRQAAALTLHLLHGCCIDHYYSAAAFMGFVLFTLQPFDTTVVPACFKQAHDRFLPLFTQKCLQSRAFQPMMQFHRKLCLSSTMHNAPIGKFIEMSQLGLCCCRACRECISWWRRSVFFLPGWPRAVRARPFYNSENSCLEDTALFSQKYCWFHWWCFWFRASCCILSGLCVVGKGYEQSCLEAINGSNPVISGYTELVRHPLEDRGRVCEYFTVLRHPIDRLVSAFFYCPPHDPQTRPKKWWVVFVGWRGGVLCFDTSVSDYTLKRNPGPFKF